MSQRAGAFTVNSPSPEKVAKSLAAFQDRYGVPVMCTEFGGGGTNLYLPGRNATKNDLRACKRDIGVLHDEARKSVVDVCAKVANEAIELQGLVAADELKGASEHLAVSSNV